MMWWFLLALFIVYQAVTWALSRIRITSHQVKYVLITGCDSGFGNLLAKSLDGLGFKVFATCLTQQGADGLQRACSERVRTVMMDVTDQSSIDSAQRFVEDNLPDGKGLWGLVNNAGVAGITTPSEWQTQADWDLCLSVNLYGVINVTRSFLPLVRQGQGRVVNMSSMMGRIVAASGPYCVSKFGVEAFSDCLRRETYSQGIKVCLIEPGYFRTDIISLSLVGSFQKSFNKTPEDVKKYYPDLTVEKFTKLIQFSREKASPDTHLVVDAIVLALTSRFPPTRQLVGNDARFFARLLWNLPTPLTDWILKQGIKTFGQ